MHAMPSGAQQCVNLPQLLLDLPWVAGIQPDEGPDTSNLARRLSKEAADAVPMWDLSIALDALRLLLWPVVPGDMPPGEFAGSGMALVSATDSAEPTQLGPACLTGSNGMRSLCKCRSTHSAHQHVQGPLVCCCHCPREQQQERQPCPVVDSAQSWSAIANGQSAWPQVYCHGFQDQFSAYSLPWSHKPCDPSRVC